MRGPLYFFSADVRPYDDEPGTWQMLQCVAAHVKSIVPHCGNKINIKIASQPGASILRGVGRAISHIFESGVVDGLVILGFDRLLLVVALCIPVMPIVNRDYLKLFITVCLCKQHIAQYFGDSDICILEYLNHAGPKSKMSPCSAQIRWILLHRVRCGGWSPIYSGGLDAPGHNNIEKLISLCTELHVWVTKFGLAANVGGFRRRPVWQLIDNCINVIPPSAYNDHTTTDRCIHK